ncbi:MAG: sensor histidine kinase [Gammaproteobacteria bacterium]|nr:sensor histidine kinase [Gammaproteobacteria bacterium]
MTRSLQSRLGLGLALSLAAIFVVQWLAVSAAIRYVVHGQIQTRLQHDAETLLALLEVPPAGAPRFPFDTVSPIYHQPFSGHYYRVEIDGAVARSRSLWDEELSLPAGGVNETQGPRGQQLLVLDRAYQKGGRPVRIVVAEDMTPLSREIRRLQYVYAAMSLVFFTVLLALQVVLLRRNLAPLQHLRAEVCELEQGGRAALSEDVPGEVVPLVREINRLLAALTERLRRSRNAVGNLAHAVKAPLTVIAQQAQRPELEAFPDLRDGLRRPVEQVRGLVARELKRARIAGAAGTRALAELPRDVDDLVATLRAIYRDKALDIRVQLPAETRCAMEREDLLEMLGNLLDNACKWAAGAVTLTISHDNGDWRFAVEDDGPGAEPVDYAELTRRGVRLDETADGHGLGLAIVQDIVTAYRGQLVLERSECLGGFAAVVTLPLAGDTAA